MEREVSDGVRMAVAIVGISAFLAIVSFTIVVGNGVKASGSDALVDIRDEISVKFVKSLESGELDNEMPTATAYNILKTYERVITEVVCGVDGKTTHLLFEDPCLGDHLTGRVQLEVHEIDGEFITLVHEEKCNWKAGHCTCEHKEHLTYFMGKWQLNRTWD